LFYVASLLTADLLWQSNKRRWTGDSFPGLCCDEYRDKSKPLAPGTPPRLH